jgi:hypothetical protein
MFDIGFISLFILFDNHYVPGAQVAMENTSRPSATVSCNLSQRLRVNCKTSDTYRIQQHALLAPSPWYMKIPPT